MQFNKILYAGKINSISSTKDPFGIALGFAAALGWIFQFIFAPTWNYKKTKSWKA